MIPTRTQIAEKIIEIKNSQHPSNQEETKNYLGVWLTSIECPEKDKQKILDDIISYE